MNIVNTLTLRHLKLNKKRTLVTIIGIIISVAMITAVSTLAASFADLLTRSAIEDVGKWHVIYNNVPEENVSIIEKDNNTESVMLNRNVGFAKLPHIENPEKPYIFIQEYDENSFRDFPLTLLAGRLPNKPNEIVIPDHLLRDGGVKLKIGDQLKLNIGYREVKNQDGTMILNQDMELKSKNDNQSDGNEQLVVEKTKTYNIVGIIERPTFESFHSPAYTAIAYLNKAVLQQNDKVNVAVYEKKATSKIYSEAEKLAEKSKTEMYEGNSGKQQYKLSYNSALLRYSGASQNLSANNTMFTFGAFIIIIIIAGSVSLIYNAFAISLSERSQYLGMLTSVGATKQQKRNSIFFEGFILGVIAIPIGILSGVLGIWITFQFVNPILANFTDRFTDLQLVVSPMSILVAVLFSVITIFISVIIPARRASKISAIDSIRKSHDIRLTGKRVKTSFITRKLFGFEAELALKNLKRNNRKYRATVFSLVISIVLFMSVSAFTQFLQNANDVRVEDKNFDVAVSMYNMKDKQLQGFIKKITTMQGVNKYTVEKSLYSTNNVDENQLSQQMKSQLGPVENGKYPLTVVVKTIDKRSFEDYIKQVGGTFEPQKNGIPSVILINKANIKVEDQYVQTDMLNLQNNNQMTLEFVDENNKKYEQPLFISTLTDKVPMGSSLYNLDLIPTLITTENNFNQILKALSFNDSSYYQTTLYFNSSAPTKVAEKIQKIITEEGITASITDNVKERIQQEQLQLFLKVFAYGFIVLITIICIANIFNTITTSIALRKREFAMLKSVGMTPGGFNKMMNYESMFYGIKALLYGLPIGFGIVLLLYKVVSKSFFFPFSINWLSIITVIIAVFLIVGITMFYSNSKVKKDNIIDALKQENI